MSRAKSSALSFRSLSPQTETKRVVGAAGPSNSLASMVASEKLSVVDGNNNRRRKQHQLVASNNASSSSVVRNYPCVDYSGGCTSEDEERRRLAAMRLLLDSLQLATANTTLSTTKTTRIRTKDPNKFSSRVPEILSLVQNEDNKQEGSSESVTMNETKDAERIGEEFTSTTEEVQTQMASESKTSLLADGAPRSKDFELLKAALRRSIHRKDIEKSLFLFRESQRKRQILPRVTVTDLFFMVSEFDPPAGYTIINYYNKHYLHQDAGQSDGGRALDGNTSKRLSLYKRICNSISLLDPNHHNTRQMHIMIEDLLNEIEEMDMNSKRILYPKLVLSLVSQRIATIGQYASDLYYFITDNEFEMRAGWLNRLLSTSRYNRKNDIPYHDVIARLVQTPGGQLNPDAILPAMQNMFPYTEMEPICVTLEAWLEDFQNKISGNNDEEKMFDLNPETLIDLSMLETISTGAAQAGCSRLILLVWEVLDVCGYSPTEIIYENTVVTFANERGGVQQAFAALASMKEDGFEPSRPLIRSFSSAMRLHRSLIGKARRILTEDRQNEIASMENNHLLSLESLNVLLSSYAERADPKDAVEILDVMSDNDIQPNADSYSFVIEALGRDIKKRLKIDDQSYKQRNVEIADTILSMMEDKGIPPTTHVIRNYVELLCLAGEIETATSIVEEYLTSDNPETRRVVNNITTYRVATENAALGNFDVARKLASMMTEYVPALHRGIRSREQRSLYVKEWVESANGGAANDSQGASSPI